MAEDNVPVITTPVYLQHKLKKLKKKYEAKELEEIRKKSRQGDRHHPIITCKRPEFNFYLHQVYLKDEDIPLASKGWLHKKSSGDHFTIHRLSTNPSFRTGEVDEKEERDFDSCGIHPLVLSGLQDMGIRHPTLVQQETIPAILKQHNVLCSAETGSGKTLAYLAPIMTSLLASRSRRKQTLDVVGAPEVLILAPARELGMQIADVARKLSQHCDIKVDALVGHEGAKVCEERLEVLVATVGLVAKLRQKRKLDLSLLRQVVLDEVDTLLDDSFSPLVCQALEDVRAQDSRPDSFQEGVQVVLVGATLPDEVAEPLRGLVDEETLLRVSTPQLHRLLPHVQHKFLRMKSQHKAGALLELVKKDADAGRASMVFSNAASCCEWVTRFLEENHVSVTKLHGELRAQVRKENYNRFLSGDVPVLSCTDLGSRGLDTAHVEHVVNFDFPYHMSDYIHRVGRIGRVGSRVTEGRVTNFVVSPPQVALAQKIELAARRTKALPSVNANIARFLGERNAAKELEQEAQEHPGSLG